MNKKMALSAKVSAAALIAGMITGCATTGDLERVEQKADDAAATAAAAQNSAESARSQSDAAMRTAEEAQACCLDNKERLDRAFRRSMYK